MYYEGLLHTKNGISSQWVCMLSGAEKRKILRLLGGSRQDFVFRGAKAAVFQGLSRAADHSGKSNPSGDVFQAEAEITAGLTSKEASTVRMLT